MSYQWNTDKWLGNCVVCMLALMHISLLLYLVTRYFWSNVDKKTTVLFCTVTNHYSNLHKNYYSGHNFWWHRSWWSVHLSNSNWWLLTWGPVKLVVINYRDRRADYKTYYFRSWLLPRQSSIMFVTVFYIWVISVIFPLPGQNISRLFPIKTVVWNTRLTGQYSDSLSRIWHDILYGNNHGEFVAVVPWWSTSWLYWFHLAFSAGSILADAG